jgi:hypothetical protein
MNLREFEEERLWVTPGLWITRTSTQAKLLTRGVAAQPVRPWPSVPPDAGKAPLRPLKAPQAAIVADADQMAPRHRPPAEMEGLPPVLEVQPQT